jgi:hypothetical protein
MTRTSALARKWAARRQSREFERALRTAPPSMAQELRVIAARAQSGNL